MPIHCMFIPIKLTINGALYQVYRVSYKIFRTNELYTIVVYKVKKLIKLILMQVSEIHLKIYNIYQVTDFRFLRFYSW